MWARWTRTSARVGRCCAHFVPNSGSLYIDAGKPAEAQQYNRFDRLFAASKPLSNIRNFKFDTPKSRPYKPCSHGERGVPKTSRVIAAKVLATQMVPLASRWSRPSGRALYASSVRKGIRRRRRTSALCADVFVVASSNVRPQGWTVISDGISKLLFGGAR